MKSKKILTVILFAVLFAAMTVLFSSCDKETSSGYVSDEEREAHILTLLGGNLDNVMDPADYTVIKASGEKNDPNKALGIIGMSKIFSNENYTLY